MYAARSSEVDRPRGPAPATDGLVTLLEALCRAVGIATAEIRLADGGLTRSRPSGPDLTEPRRLAEIPLGPDGELGVLSLYDPRAPRLSDAQEACLSGYVIAAALAVAQRRDRAALARLSAERTVMSAIIRDQGASLAHLRRTFDDAARAVRIGVWECRLADERLTWTDGVYDIFEIPRGAELDREETLRCYPPGARETMEALRTRAIAEGGGFHLDTEIVTMRGRRRWMRLTATVECEDGVPVRIFGMKQDITDEKLQADHVRQRAEVDGMTGLPNRSVFETRLSGLTTPAPDALHPDAAPAGALLLVDLDGFKAVNDTFGHAVGDTCLTQAARRLRDACSPEDFVARIGGDEFAVLLAAPFGNGAAEACAERIVAALRTRIERDGRTVQLGASVGIARIEGGDPAAVFDRADQALYAAKSEGRNTHRAYPSRMSGTAALAS